MADELGTGHREVARNLFDLDEVRSSTARRADPGTKREAGAKAASPMPDEVEDPTAAAPRPVRKPTTGAGPVLLLSVEEAARSLSISRSKTWELIAAGELEAVHIGRSTRVAVSALHDLLDRLPRAADG